jgi:hypothetical protein
LEHEIIISLHLPCVPTHPCAKEICRKIRKPLPEEKGKDRKPEREKRPGWGKLLSKKGKGFVKKKKLNFFKYQENN